MKEPKASKALHTIEFAKQKMSCWQLILLICLLGPWGTTTTNAEAADEAKLTASLGDEIILEIPDLKSLKAKETPARKLALFIDCAPLNGVHATAWCIPDKKVRFLLERTDDNRGQWQSLLKSLNGKIVPIGIGFADDPETVVLAMNSPMRLEVFKGPWPYIAAALILALLLLLLIYGALSNLLRDLTPFPESAFKQTPNFFFRWLPGLGTIRGTGIDRPPFSLGRVQMAFWFFVITAAYLFLWLVLGDRNSFNATALTLLGISLTTGLVSRAIDVGKQGNVNQLKTEKAQLDARRASLESPNNPTPTDESKQQLANIKARIAQIDQQIKEAVVPPNEHKSEGFLSDILSDENGISLHRVQMVGWTLVLGLVFVAEVVTNLAMPVFDNTLLGLMGISSGAFIGFKFPEKKSVTTADSQQ
jgi:hypothetical protein